MEEDDLDTPANEENDELEEVESYEPAKLRYYESPKVLGQLYREIDEHKFLEQIQAQSGFLSRNTGTTHSLIKAVWTYVREKAMVIQWHHCIRFAEDVKERYVTRTIHLRTQSTMVYPDDILATKRIWQILCYNTPATPHISSRRSKSSAATSSARPAPRANASANSPRP